MSVLNDRKPGAAAGGGSNAMNHSRRMTKSCKRPGRHQRVKAGKLPLWLVLAGGWGVATMLFVTVLFGGILLIQLMWWLLALQA